MWKAANENSKTHMGLEEKQFVCWAFILNAAFWAFPVFFNQILKVVFLLYSLQT